jgi:hypothetical protein
MPPAEEIAELEELLRELLAGMQEILQSGEIMSDEFQGQVAQTLNALTDRIDQLQRENPISAPSPPQEEPPLEEGMASSNVNSFGYDPENQRLLVKFNGRDQRDNGPVYGYDGVPKVIFDLFQSGAIPARTNGRNRWGRWWQGKVPSLGASLYTLIGQGQYPYQRLS